MKGTKPVLWQLIAVFMVLAMVLASCATPEPEVIIQTVEVEKEVQVEVEKTVEVEVEKVVEVTAEAPAEAVKLNPEVSGKVEIWHFWASPVRRNALRHIVAICGAKLPNIEITETVKPWGDIWTANIAAVAAGSGMPDVIVSDRPTVPKDAADGIYMNLQDYADRDGISRDQFYGWAWDQALYEGDTYGLPFETDVRVLFWNKQLFTEAGLDPEVPPTTWEELEAYADLLDVKNDDGTYARIGFFPLWNAGFNPFWAYLNGAPLILEDGTPALNTPEAVEALTWVKKWVDRYGGWQNLANFKASFGAPPNDVFMGNGVAMFIDIFGYNSQLEFYRPRAILADGSTPRMDWGVATLPYNTTPANWSGGFSLSVPTGSPNADAAWEFIKCATGPEGQASWARDTQAQPTNLIAANDPILLSNPLWAVVDQALQVSTGGVFVEDYPNWGQELDQRFEKVWNGELTPQEALDEAQAAVEDVLGE
ncbi:MAG: ABC transporter substrate-binding protein [Anaerolineaceae bacterium]|nr:ABC transporter substrate-binding protein [Anaerolineaceae bacterium]